MRPDSRRIADHTFIFVGGLHRSGTSLVARCLAAHPAVSAFRDTGVPEDEGQHLQSVLPPARVFGGPGRFALHPDAHLTESSPLVSDESRERLLSEWGPHWDLEKEVLLEKSPPNLIRGRLLQALFPGSMLVAVVRHPLAVAYATQRWSRSSLRSLIRHWLAAHETFAADRSRLERAAALRFETLIEHPDAALVPVFALAGLEPVPAAVEVRRDANEVYLDRWRNENRVRRARLIRSHEERVNAFGYSLRDPHRVEAGLLGLGEPLRV